MCPTAPGAGPEHQASGVAEMEAAGRAAPGLGAFEILIIERGS